MGSIFVSCLLSLGLIWAFSACARSKYWGMTGACFLAAGVSILSTVFVCLVFPAIALQSALTFVLLLGCGVFKRNAKSVVPMSIAAMVASYGFFLWTGFTAIQNLSKLRVQYPLESVSDRLAYEAKKTDRVAQVEAASQQPFLSPGVEQRLVSSEDRRTRSDQPWRHNRRTMLASLHTRKSDDFAIAQGFGRGRMMPGFVSERVIELPKVEPIPIPTDVDPNYDPGHNNDALADEDKPARLLPAKDDLLSIHDSGILDFVDPDRIGYVKDPDHVAGFQSHRFTRMPQTEGQPPASWKVARLELVSLLKHEVPVAYVSQHLPQMDELREAPTRPLEAFERQSLDSLRSDEDVMIDETPGRIRMVGSLRASKTCLECHSVRRGDLLGALTYELVPLRPSRKKAPQISPPRS